MKERVLYDLKQKPKLQDYSKSKLAKYLDAAFQYFSHSPISPSLDLTRSSRKTTGFGKCLCAAMVRDGLAQTMSKSKPPVTQSLSNVSAGFLARRDVPITFT